MASDVRVKQPDGLWTSIVGPPGAKGDNGASGAASTVPGPTGPQGIQGAPGVSTVIRGEVATVAALPPVASVAVGDGYIVTADGDLYTSTGTAWLSVGQIVGPQGPTGATGAASTVPGPTGPAGATGATGVGVPVGGATNQRLAKIDGTDYNTTWVDAAIGISGGGLGNVFEFIYSPTLTEPPTGSQIRFNASTYATTTKVWIRYTATDGVDIRNRMLLTTPGNKLYIQDLDTSTQYVIFTVTGAVVDKGSSTYGEVPVSLYQAGSALVASQHVLTGIIETAITDHGSLTGLGDNDHPQYALTARGLPAGGTTAQVLAKTSGTDYDAAWATAVPTSRSISTTAPLQGGGDLSANRTLTVDAATTTAAGVAELATVSETDAHGAINLAVTPAGLANHALTSALASYLTSATAATTYAPIRRTLNAQTGTTYTPVVADENLMVTLSNAAAITVTLPSNATQAIPVGAEIDFLWLGVGQPTFAAGSGATVNGTPGLKLRARYSAATAKKVATNDFVIIGDLSA